MHRRDPVLIAHGLPCFITTGGGSAAVSRWLLHVLVQFSISLCLAKFVCSAATPACPRRELRSCLTVTHIQELECAGWSTSSCISSLCVAEEHSGLQCCTVMAQHAGLLEHVESREVCDWLESLVSAMRRSVCSGWCARREVFLGLCNSPTLLQQPQPYVNIFACGEIPRLIVVTRHFAVR